MVNFSMTLNVKTFAQKSCSISFQRRISFKPKKKPSIKCSCQVFTARILVICLKWKKSEKILRSLVNSQRFTQINFNGRMVDRYGPNYPNRSSELIDEPTNERRGKKDLSVKLCLIPAPAPSHMSEFSEKSNNNKIDSFNFQNKGTKNRNDNWKNRENEREKP